MNKLINSSALIWSTDDVYANMTEDRQNSKEWTEEELLSLGKKFFDTHNDWLIDTISDAMIRFLHFENK